MVGARLQQFVLIYYTPTAAAVLFRNLFCGGTEHIYMPPLASFNWLLLKGELGVSSSEDWDCWQLCDVLKTRQDSLEMNSHRDPC